MYGNISLSFLFCDVVINIVKCSSSINSMIVRGKFRTSSAGVKFENLLFRLFVLTRVTPVARRILMWKLPKLAQLKQNINYSWSREVELNLDYPQQMDSRRNKIRMFLPRPLGLRNDEMTSLIYLFIYQMASRDPRHWRSFKTLREDFLMLSDAPLIWTH